MIIFSAATRFRANITLLDIAISIVACCIVYVILYIANVSSITEYLLTFYTFYAKMHTSSPDSPVKHPTTGEEMPNKQARKTNKTASSATVSRENQPGYKKVNRKKRSTGVVRVQQGNTLMDAILKGDRGFEDDRSATQRTFRSANRRVEIKYGAVKTPAEKQKEKAAAEAARRQEAAAKMAAVAKVTASVPQPVKESTPQDASLAKPKPVTTSAPRPAQQSKRPSFHERQAELAKQHPEFKALKPKTLAHRMATLMLDAYPTVKKTDDKGVTTVAYETAKATLTEADQKRPAVNYGHSVTRKALSWAYEQLAKPAQAKAS